MPVVAHSSIHGPPPPTTTFLGRAGEYFVAGHLLRLGYNTSVLPVDSGVDLLAHWTTKAGDSRVAQFQVKTTRSKRTSFTFTKRQITRYWSEGVNLIVVFWYESEAPFTVVVPPRLLYMLTSGGHKDPRAPIRFRSGRTTIVVRSSASRRAVIRNRHNDISAMVDRFDRIDATDDDATAIPDYASWAASGSPGLVQIDE